ncbi:hypothetical protein Dimus_001117 [Dionaea muscipula]
MTPATAQTGHHGRCLSDRQLKREDDSAMGRTDRREDYSGDGSDGSARRRRSIGELGLEDDSAMARTDKRRRRPSDRHIRREDDSTDDSDMRMTPATALTDQRWRCPSDQQLRPEDDFSDDSDTRMTPVTTQTRG